MLALMALPLTLMAQKKAFTLDDLIPGGKTFYSLQPDNKYFTWWENTCVEQDVDECRIVNAATGEKSVLATREQVNKVLEANGLRPLSHFYYASFPSAEKLIMTSVANETAIINLENNSLVWKSKIDTGAENKDFNHATRSTAYTVDHNLFVQTSDGKVHQVSKDGSLKLVYGESVHRNEFGINKGTFWSPSGKLLAFYRMDQSMVSPYPQVNVTPLVNTQMYAGNEDLKSRCATIEPDPYPMAGETSHKVSVGIYNVETQKTIYLQTGDPTDRYFTNISWSPDNKKLYLIELNRDQNHAKLDEYDAETGALISTLFTEDNEKYVEPMNPIQFLPWDKTKFIYQTRKDGYNHIYLFNNKGKQLKQLTSGKYEVIDVLGFNPASKSIIYTSNEKDALQQNVYKVDMNGKRTIIGNTTGWHNANLSASGTYVIDMYSSPKIARNIDLVSTDKNKSVNLLTATNKWDEYNVPEMKVGTLKAADGVTDVYYRLILPTDFDPNKKYPAVIYVYGGPHAHNIDATRNWGARGWDIWMAQKGYVMFCLDNRGSEHRGLAFEQATFRNLGVEEMKDQMKGVEYLKSLPYVDADRIGVHGWSFGGFMTSSLMTTYPETFKVGVAGGPVIDWGFYEVMYGERYMDTPESNPEGYKNTSLLNKAKNLKGRLMVIYGGNDNTCVPQHTLSFMRACINADTYPDLFTYPGDGHNMSGTDRIHLHNVITRYFEDHLK